MQRIPGRMWGGTHIQITIEGQSATIGYDCAHGTIDGPLTVDRHGKFSLRGTHAREHPGPIRLNQTFSGSPAKYTGWTDGEKMTLTVTLMSGEVVGTFNLVRGHEGQLRKCK